MKKDATKPPDRIFLQWLGTDDPATPGGMIETCDVTWASEEIWETDVEYVRVKKRKREQQ